MTYANETQLIVTSVESLLPKIENVTKVTSDWYYKNGLKKNSGKSKVLLLSHKNKGLFSMNVIENGEHKINARIYCNFKYNKLTKNWAWLNM